jgi:hypothetical protein
VQAFPFGARQPAMLLILLLILGFPPMITTTQPWQICSSTSNYTANSTYQPWFWDSKSKKIRT